MTLEAPTASGSVPIVSASPPVPLAPSGPPPLAGMPFVPPPEASARRLVVRPSMPALPTRPKTGHNAPTWNAKRHLRRMILTYAIRTVSGMVIGIVVGVAFLLIAEALGAPIEMRRALLSLGSWVVQLGHRARGLIS